MTVIASISPLGAGFFLKELFAAYPGNADVLVGWDTDDSGRSRKHADGDVGAPRIVLSRKNPRRGVIGSQ